MAVTEPTTEAGRALLAAYNGGSTFPIRNDILAIEAEARAAALSELREEVGKKLRPQRVEGEGGQEARPRSDAEGVLQCIWPIMFLRVLDTIGWEDGKQ